MFLFLRNVFVSLGRVSYTWQVTLLESAFEFLASVTLVAAGAAATAAAFGRARGLSAGAMIAACPGDALPRPQGDRQSARAATCGR